MRKNKIEIHYSIDIYNNENVSNSFGKVSDWLNRKEITIRHLYDRDRDAESRIVFNNGELTFNVPLDQESESVISLLDQLYEQDKLRVPRRVPLWKVLTGADLLCSKVLSDEVYFAIVDQVGEAPIIELQRIFDRIALEYAKATGDECFNTQDLIDYYHGRRVRVYDIPLFMLNDLSDWDADELVCSNENGEVIILNWQESA